MNKERQSKIKAESDALRAKLKELNEQQLKGEEMTAYAAAARARVEAIKDAEEEAFEKLPESAQYSAKGEAAEEGIGILEEALDTFDELIYAVTDDEATWRDIKEIGYDICNLLQYLV